MQSSGHYTTAYSGDDQKESTQVFGGAGSPAASVRDFGND